MSQNDTYEIRTETRESTLIVHLIGELNIARTSSLLDTIDKEIEPFKNVIIDLTKVTYMNSTAIGALLGYQHKESHNTKLVVIPDGHIQLLFNNLSIQNVFPIFASVELALNGG